MYKAVPKACKIFQTLMLSNWVFHGISHERERTYSNPASLHIGKCKRLLRTGLLVGYCLCQSSTAAPIALSHPITPVNTRALSASELRVGDSWKTQSATGNKTSGTS